MDTIFNKSAIAKKMRPKPKKLQLYSFMEGANNLSVRQIESIESLIDSEFKSMKAFLGEQKIKAQEKKIA